MEEGVLGLRIHQVEEIIDQADEARPEDLKGTVPTHGPSACER